MSNTNRKILEFFARILKLEANRTNWVIFKDHFLFAAAAASLIQHIDGTEAPPTSPVTPVSGSDPSTADQKEALDNYTGKLLRWWADEAIIRQAIASMISDSLFLEVRKKESAKEMLEAVKEQREKKSRMVTVDMWCKLQAEKCPESGDIRAHLHKLQAMREDLVLMGGSISDEDFTSIILGSIPQSYDTYIATITATSTLLDRSLLPTNLIDAICDEADQRTIKNPKPKKDEQDAAFMAGQSTGKGKKGGEGLKKSKKGVKCYSCKKLGHFAKDCWAPGGGSEGKGPKGKGKEKEVAAKADDKGGSDSDAVWMVSASVIYHIFIKFISRLYPNVLIPTPTSDYTTSLIISYSLVLIFTCFYDSYLFCSCFQYFWFLATSYILHSSCMLHCFCTICSELLWHSTPVLCSLFDYDPIRLISITIPIRPDLV